MKQHILVVTKFAYNHTFHFIWLKKVYIAIFFSAFFFQTIFSFCIKNSSLFNNRNEQVNTLNFTIKSLWLKLNLLILLFNRTAKCKKLSIIWLLCQNSKTIRYSNKETRSQIFEMIDKKCVKDSSILIDFCISSFVVQSV